jgi:hypothetical protein
MTQSCAKVMVLVPMGAGVHAAAPGAQKKPAGKETVILDTSGFWRDAMEQRMMESPSNSTPIAAVQSVDRRNRR